MDTRFPKVCAFILLEIKESSKGLECVVILYVNLKFHLDIIVCDVINTKWDFFKYLLLQNI